MPEAHRVLPMLPAEVDRLGPSHLGHQARKVHEPHLEVLGHAAHVEHLLQHLLDLDPVAVEPLGPRLPVALVHHGAARDPDPLALRAERLLERARAPVELHRFTHELAQSWNHRVDRRSGEESLGHRVPAESGVSTKIA